MKYDLGQIETRLAAKAKHDIGLASDPLRDIEDALERLNTGDFGYCRACSQPIAIKRLCDDPTISLCTTCSEN